MKTIQSVHNIITSLNNAFHLVSGESYAQKLVYKFHHEIQALLQNKTLMLEQSTIRISNYPFSPPPFTSFLL